MIARRFTIRLAACSASALLAGATLLAQAPGGAPGGQQPMPQPTQPSSPDMPAQQAGPGAPDTSPQGMADHAFVSDAMQGDLGEVQLAQLAEQKSQTADVKQYAQKLANDHSQMNQKWFEPEAKQMNIGVPKKPSKKDQKLMKKLEGLNGQQFDQAYLTAMVKDHQNDLKKFKEEADATQDPALKQVAQQGANIITQHLQLAEQVAKKDNIPIQSGKQMSDAK